MPESEAVIYTWHYVYTPLICMYSLRDSFNSSLNAEDAVCLQDNRQLLEVSIYFTEATIYRKQVALSPDSASWQKRKHIAIIWFLAHVPYFTVLNHNKLSGDTPPGIYAHIDMEGMYIEEKKNERRQSHGCILETIGHISLGNNRKKKNNDVGL
jgi:hypothetical protein